MTETVEVPVVAPSNMSDDTLILGNLSQELYELLNPPTSPSADQTIVDDALELVAQLWPGYRRATVVEDGPTWDKLRRVLLAVPALWTEANRT